MKIPQVNFDAIVESKVKLSSTTAVAPASRCTLRTPIHINVETPESSLV